MYLRSEILTSFDNCQERSPREGWGSTGNPAEVLACGGILATREARDSFGL